MTAPPTPVAPVPAPQTAALAEPGVTRPVASADHPAVATGRPVTEGATTPVPAARTVPADPLRRPRTARAPLPPAPLSPTVDTGAIEAARRHAASGTASRIAATVRPGTSDPTAPPVPDLAASLTATVAGHGAATASEADAHVTSPLPTGEQHAGPTGRTASGRGPGQVPVPDPGRPGGGVAGAVRPATSGSPIVATPGGPRPVTPQPTERRTTDAAEGPVEPRPGQPRFSVPGLEYLVVGGPVDEDLPRPVGAPRPVPGTPVAPAWATPTGAPAPQAAPIPPGTTSLVTPDTVDPAAPASPFPAPAPPAPTARDRRRAAAAEKQAAAAERAAQKQTAAAERAAQKQTAAAERAAQKQTAAAERAAQKQTAAAERAAQKQTAAAERAAQKQTAAAERAAQKQTATAERAAQKQTATAERAAQKQTATAERAAQKQTATVERAAQKQTAAARTAPEQPAPAVGTADQPAATAAQTPDHRGSEGNDEPVVFARSAASAVSLAGRRGRSGRRGARTERAHGLHRAAPVGSREPHGSDAGAPRRAGARTDDPRRVSRTDAARASRTDGPDGRPAVSPGTAAALAVVAGLATLAVGAWFLLVAGQVHVVALVLGGLAIGLAVTVLRARAAASWTRLLSLVGLVFGIAGSAVLLAGLASALAPTLGLHLPDLGTMTGTGSATSVTW
ncbi:hypothetical protein [Curtobacterium sp. MCBD17_040]|uniref:hypothetical protein n=1 Tax=Curtobacterium sp. MCBD17_040 TaxID=2175674 RepID=UPI0024E038B3|nr:hypothetical protein [Curtobacterium sp. MCBD17_040]WIB64735.1 hypothetical protein DEI94_05970 [Curtobacterium sp. MCBD17_040]